MVKECDALAQHKQTIEDRLWEVFKKDMKGDNKALAHTCPGYLLDSIINIYDAVDLIKDVGDYLRDEASYQWKRLLRKSQQEDRFYDGEFQEELMEAADHYSKLVEMRDYPIGKTVDFINDSFDRFYYENYDLPEERKREQERTKLEFEQNNADASSKSSKAGQVTGDKKNGKKPVKKEAEHMTRPAAS